MAEIREDVAYISGKKRTTQLLGPLIEKAAELFGAEWTKHRCRKCGNTWR